MFAKESLLIFFLALLSNASCLLDDDLYHSIAWNDDSLPFVFDGSVLIMQQKKYILNDYKLSPKGMICFSKNGKYARVAQKIQNENICPTLGYSFFELNSDTLKNCEYKNKVDMDSVIEATLKKFKNKHGKKKFQSK